MQPPGESAPFSTPGVLPSAASAAPGAHETTQHHGFSRVKVRRTGSTPVEGTASKLIISR